MTNIKLKIANAAPPALPTKRSRHSDRGQKSAEGVLGHLWNGSSGESGRSRKGQGRQHQDDNGRVGHVHAGLARLFRLLRNARGADSPHSLGPTATAGRTVAPMENPTASPRGTDRKWNLRVGRTRPAAAAVLGISPAAELSRLGSQMLTSNRSACHPCSNRFSATSRTAV